ncbi:hypothetical protein [Pseudomonas azerbaijanoccidentalis]
MDNNGPIHAPLITANMSLEEEGISASGQAFPKQYTVMTINITNNTNGPIRLLAAGWDLTGTSLSDFDVDAVDEQTLNLPYYRDFSSNGLTYNKRKFAPLRQQLSYATEDGLICTIDIQLTITIGFGVLHPTLCPNWKTTITRSGNSNSRYPVTAEITDRSKDAPFSFSVDLIFG